MSVQPLRMRARRPLVHRDGFWAFLMLLPNVVGFLMFILIPVVATFIISFASWDLTDNFRFVGLDNYAELASDKTFHQVFWNTVYFTVVSVPIGIVISLFLAILLNQPLRFMRFYRAAFFIPVISSMVAVAVIWQWIYNPQFGLLNYALSWFGIQGPTWLTSTRWAMIAIIITAIWKGLGFNMLIFLAGLQSIPESYYEAAEIDGARWFARFRHITIPLLSPTTFFITVMAVINSFQVFDTVYLMTQGGPARSTSVLVYYIYQNAFQFFQMGYASAMAYVLFFVVLFITLLQFWRQGRISIY
jgi:multiple sugar transport system permease protein